MTEKLYFSSDQISINASVLACVEVQEGYEIILDRTVFHPQGGGQPSDIGHIDAARVKKVIQRKGTLVHCVDAPLAIGNVRLQVDVLARLLNSRLHTAGHLIGNVVTSFGFVATRAHHWPGDACVYASAELTLGRPDLTKAGLQKCMDELVAQDLLRSIKICEEHREIGFGDLPYFPCGGTHVVSTRVVGKCIIDEIISDKGGVRVRYSVA